MANLYTKTGDKGTTGLVGGSRVSKTDIRVHCYGQIDEAQAMLGLAYASSKNEYVRTTVHGIQSKLFTVGAELASDEKGMKYLGEHIIHDEDVQELEKIVDFCTETTGKQHDFVIPGANQASAALHVARTIVRRAERQIIAAKKSTNIRDELLRYVNRLSDAIYALARLEETEVEQQELIEKIKSIILEQVGNGAVSDDSGNTKLTAFTLDAAKKMAVVAEQKAKEMGVPIVFSCVDNGGNTMLIHRMDDSFQGSIEISLNKAYTANAFQAPSDALGKEAQPGGCFYGLNTACNGRLVLFGGGLPLKLNGKCVGALGVSGGSAEEDLAIARAALEEWKRLS